MHEPSCATFSEFAAMESVPLRHPISATRQSFLGRRKGKRETPSHIRKFGSNTGRLPLPLIHCKQFEFQDFQDYAKPSRILPATEVKLCTDTSARKVFPSFWDADDDGSRSLYMVKLGTSNIFGSNLTNLNSGILLCLINQNGDSILQRISASLVTDYFSESNNDILHFQRGSVDVFTFEGPKLGKVEALWIGLESGQWRLGSISLTVISRSQTSVEEKGGGELEYVSFKYEFEAGDILLGEGSNNSMVELRPSFVTKLSGVDPSTLFSNSLSGSTLLGSQGMSNEETMREYANLKFSLLLYDTILIFIGTSASSFSAGENAGFAFLVGGISGFLYLLLLQRSVDELPATASGSQNTGATDQMFGGYKGPLSSVALAIGFVLFTIKYGSGDLPMMFTGKDLIFGMVGFLACKVAVVLAAFKPVTMGLKMNK